MPGKKALLVGRINLPVYFGTAANFRKETLTFEVVGFRGTYHAIIGRLGYAMFMAIPNYTYLKLKMPGPKGVITVSSSYEHTYACDVECVEYGEVVESSTDLASRLEALAAGAPELKCQAGSFEPAWHTEGSHQALLEIQAGSKPMKQRLRRFDEEKRTSLARRSTSF